MDSVASLRDRLQHYVTHCYAHGLGVQIDNVVMVDMIYQNCLSTNIIHEMYIDSQRMQFKSEEGTIQRLIEWLQHRYDALNIAQRLSGRAFANSLGAGTPAVSQSQSSASTPSNYHKKSFVAVESSPSTNVDAKVLASSEVATEDPVEEEEEYYYAFDFDDMYDAGDAENYTHLVNGGESTDE